MDTGRSGKFITLWSFNIAMENGPFIVDFPIKTSIYGWFSMAMLNNQMANVHSSKIAILAVPISGTKTKAGPHRDMASAGGRGMQSLPCQSMSQRDFKQGEKHSVWFMYGQYMVNMCLIYGRYMVFWTFIYPLVNEHNSVSGQKEAMQAMNNG